MNFKFFPGDSMVKNPSAMQEMQVWSLDQEDPLEEDMATHSNILVGKIPRTAESGGLQLIGLQRFRRDKVNDQRKAQYINFKK